MASFTQQMAINDIIDLTDTNLVEPASYLTTSATQWSWNTGGALDVNIVIKGTGFTYVGNNAISGSVTSVEFYIDQSNSPGFDFDITGLQNVDITRLNLGAQEFWNELLKGNDNFDLIDYSGTPIGTNIQFGDDFASATTLAAFPPLIATDSGGDDFFVDGFDSRDLIGDVFNVVGSTGSGLLNNWAVYDAGDDFFRGQSSSKNYRVVGDAWSVGAYAILNGGNDTINSSASSGSGSMTIGDVYEQNGGTVNGGDDVINGHSGYLGNVGAYNVVGDVYDFNGGILVGGNDFIQANHGGGQISGDVDQASGSGTITGGDDTIIGSYQNDAIYGDIGFFADSGSGLTITNGNDIIYGGAGHDRIYGDSSGGLGSGGNDRLFGQAGGDTIYGGGGNDFMDGGSGDDEIDGGDGVDTVSYATAMTGVSVDLSITGSQATVGAGLDIISYVENLEGSWFDDTLAGDASNNIVYGLAGNDTIRGGSGGTDFLYGGAGSDTVTFAILGAGVSARLSGVATSTAFGGSDTLSGIEMIIGSTYADSLMGDYFANTLSGGAGADNLFGGDGNDILYANDGGQTGDSSVTNRLWGNEGDDTLYGAEGSDILVGDEGSDIFFGGAGDDWIYVEGNDLSANIHGGAGFDRVLISTTGSSFVLDVTAAEVESVFGGVEADTLDASGSNTTVWLQGGGGNDALTGGNAVDVLTGNNGNDVMNGGLAIDWLYGGAGSDALNGGLHDDFLIGNVGGGGDGVLDTYVFEDNWGTDRIYDFDDTIDIIDMSAVTGLTSFGQLTISAADGGANSSVTFGGDTIFVMNTTIAQLSAADFLV